MHTIKRNLAVRQIDKHARLAREAEAAGRDDQARRHRRWLAQWHDALALLA